MRTAELPDDERARAEELRAKMAPDRVAIAIAVTLGVGLIVIVALL